VLVVNHGIWPPEDAPIAHHERGAVAADDGVNLDSVFGLVQAAVAQMLKQDRLVEDAPRGHIVLISSTAGQRGEANHADYAVTKGALISLTKSLSSELAPQGILVNCVAPDGFRPRCRRQRWTIPKWDQGSRPGIPVGRPGSAREIAGPVLFLCTPLAGFISGEVLNVNGGAVLVG
jgi:3-oxoacyl-[acyl-carrier protein] reductase